MNGIDLAVGADEAFTLVSDAAGLRKWFAEDVSIDPQVGGVFTFAGDGAYEPTSTTLTRYEPGRLLAWDWPAPRRRRAGDASKSRPRMTTRRRPALTSPRAFPNSPTCRARGNWSTTSWRFHLGNLKALTEGGERVLLPDFGDPTLEVRQSIHIAAPRAAVFQALVDPAMLKEWTMFGKPDVDLHVGGKYSYGWVYEAGGKMIHGGPTRILELEQDVRLVTDWLDWRGDDTNNCQRITWLLEDEGDGTKLTLVHDGFVRGGRYQRLSVRLGRLPRRDRAGSGEGSDRCPGRQCRSGRMSGLRGLPALMMLATAIAPLTVFVHPDGAIAQATSPGTTATAASATAPSTVSPATVVPLPAGRITGVGGIFFRSKDPKALMAWYRDVLGLKVEDWGGVVMSYDAPKHPPAVTVTAFTETSAMMAPSRREFMINFAVDDLDAFLTRIKSKGVTVLKRDDSDPYGKFAWILDPDDTKIELYEPKPDRPAG